ncbi:MAG TPA: SAM-dependent methyltransferase [Verrucomicrobium sp.]|nr:SAM-dependent methyltransferase [Verrucomicrobium sp.]
MANAIPAVTFLLQSRLEAAPGQRLPWAEVMQMALYEPEKGYYRQGVRRIGRSGDFYTSVSVGPLFGSLLAEYGYSLWRESTDANPFTLIEQGAHDGTLAHDVLSALRQAHPDLYERARYLIIEPDPGLRVAQAEKLGADFPGKLLHVEAWSAVPASTGLVLCNELLDAFAVHRVQFTTEGWRELYVELGESGALAFGIGPVSTPDLERELDLMGTDFPIGFTTEINVAMIDWLEEVAESAFQGELLLADYGHAAREYYIPERSGGTLRRYYQHRSDDNVLEALGDADLTSHVNFTRLAEAAQSLGWQVTEFIEQGRFLTGLAAELMRQPGFTPTPAWMRQFQTLTHPGHLGHSFQILTLRRVSDLKVENNHLRRDSALRRLGMENAPSR